MQYGRDWFIETLPEVIELVALGKVEKQLETLRQVIMSAVQIKYPVLQELAWEHVSAECDADKLNQLVPMIYMAPNEKAVRQILQEIPPVKH